MMNNTQRTVMAFVVALLLALAAVGAASIITIISDQKKEPLFTVCTIEDERQCFNGDTFSEDKERGCISGEDVRVCGPYTIVRNYIPTAPAPAPATDENKAQP